MAAVTGQQFLDLLDKMLVRANMANSAMAYYSFYPVSGQSEFIYNNLYKTGEMFLQKVCGVQMTEFGSGYTLTETPEVTFTSLDAGSGASGTAVLSSEGFINTLLNRGLVRAYTFNPSGTNLIVNHDFSSGETGWYAPGGGQLFDDAPGEYRFVNNKLYVYLTVAMTPNSGTLNISGAETGFYWGSFDLLSSSTYTRYVDIGYTSTEGVFTTIPRIPLQNQTGTFYFGGRFNPHGKFIPKFTFFCANGFLEPLIIDNIQLYTGKDIMSDTIVRNPSEAFSLAADSLNNYLYLSTGKNEMGMGQNYNSQSFVNSNIVYPTVTAHFSEDWSFYTLAFWHYYLPHTSFFSDNIILADWSNFQLQIRDGKYGLYCNYSHEYIPTTVTASGWHQFIVSVVPNRIDNISNSS